ncbi:mycothiol-dependent nitroreductase Rv2466c family protein [Arcanobacterium ihumii]|uniref:mycothiol-dependent nitroreductase Rv2466c family protein n=1 Tax=Arcanobacterium ihumii TaxID=2138162 RepID=UPI000F523C7B|nr:disulfide bond formation protein DsbA [Arcanobacterium ihumii]
MAQKVEFWFDPSCPWTWITSRWLVEVSQLRDFDIVWNPFRLWHLNEDKDIPQEYRTHLEEAMIGAQVASGVFALFPQKLGEFYSELGKLHFDEGMPKDAATCAAALAAVELDTSILDQAATGEFDGLGNESTKRGLALVGEDVGVPIIAVGDVAFFGPVLSPAPHGDDAIKLWDGTLALAQIPGFFELKRTRDTDPIFS